MPKGRAHFTSEQLVRALSHYQTGVIHQLKPIYAGNKRTPKMAFVAEKGRFILKRRSKAKDDLGRILFAHSVLAHLTHLGYPVTSLVPTHDEKNTILLLDNYIYELFAFVPGSRYDGSSPATLEAGLQLARLHKALDDFTSQADLLRTTFHDSRTVRAHLRTIGSRTATESTNPAKHLHTNGDERAVAEALMALYNDAGNRVNNLGFESWTRQVVHGDWHPGNLLFSEQKIVAVLDFDSVKIAPPITDLANAMLQFSIVGGCPDPAGWPDHFDEKRLMDILQGYQYQIHMPREKRCSLIDLMLETMIAEAVLPIAATGFFGHLHGIDFLKMILRKARWLEKNRQRLTDLINTRKVPTKA